jgi:hypothetical protein
MHVYNPVCPTPNVTWHEGKYFIRHAIEAFPSLSARQQPCLPPLSPLCTYVTLPSAVEPIHHPVSAHSCVRCLPCSRTLPSSSTAQHATPHTAEPAPALTVRQPRRPLPPALSSSPNRVNVVDGSSHRLPHCRTCSSRPALSSLPSRFWAIAASTTYRALKVLPALLVR